MGRGAGPAQPDHIARPRSLWQRLARRWRDPVIILPYLGYGTPRRLVVRGRVLEDEGFSPSADADTRWRNLVRFYKRLESDEVPGARLRARCRGVEREAVTDAEGYFRLELPARARAGWRDVDLELLHPAHATAVARVLVPSRRAKFGVISDIDDTIVTSNVTRKVRMLLTVALTNSRKRLPFPGVGELYRALHAGVNPLFYVSKSPWNLYAPIVEYLEVQKLPLGPLMLRDFGFFADRTHKKKAIEDILSTYPRLPFVLIGDSGEEDPEIYAAVARRFPGRIRAIYIRAVTRKKVVVPEGIPMVVSADSEAAAAHAAALGLIQASDLRALRAAKRLDESSSSKATVSSGGLK